MDLHVWVTFALASVVISIAPGAGAITTISTGIRYGAKQTLPAICGLQFGYSLQVVIVGVGLGALLASSAMAFQTVKWLGIAYLIWLGVQKFREAPLEINDVNQAPLNAKKQFWSSAVINITNPKITVFLVALFPQFLNVEAGNIVAQYLILGTTVVMADFLVMIGYACLAAKLAKFVKEAKHQALQNRIFGSLYMGIAGVMAAA